MNESTGFAAPTLPPPGSAPAASPPDAPVGLPAPAASQPLHGPTLPDHGMPTLPTVASPPAPASTPAADPSQPLVPLCGGLDSVTTPVTTPPPITQRPRRPRGRRSESRSPSPSCWASGPWGTSASAACPAMRPTTADRRRRRHDRSGCHVTAPGSNQRCEGCRRSNQRQRRGGRAARRDGPWQ